VTAAPPPEVEVVRWYTRARRFPQLIGRTPDGARIWGGPYTFTQAVGAGLVLFVGLNTMGLWAHYGLVGNGLILLGAAYAVVLVLGRIPVGARNPLAVAAGASRALTAPRTGRLAGRPVRLRRPRRLRHQMHVLLDPTPVTRSPANPPPVAPADRAQAAAPADPPPPAPAAAGPRPPALTGVQSLLAQTPTGRTIHRSRR
jgi:hypothetical protein